MNIGDDGGVIHNESGSDDFSLDTEKVIELTKRIAKIEDFYGFPVDIEWAYEANYLYILQARPITAFFPIEPHMMTKPNERRMLYMDANLIDSITSNKPILPLTIDWFYDAFMMFTGPLFGDVKIDGHLPPKDGMVFCGAGRVYIN